MHIARRPDPLVKDRAAKRTLEWAPLIPFSAIALDYVKCSCVRAPIYQGGTSALRVSRWEHEMAGSNAKLARVRRIMARQCTVEWNQAYVPSIFATPKEAPRCSRPVILKPAKLGLRDMHLMSGVEEGAALLALHSPNVFDIHEQHMLSPAPTQHPLASHHSSIGKQFPRIEGTINVATRLGRFAWHDKVYSDENSSWLPNIYVGDLLLFCIDSDGEYCVNWTVKVSHEDFNRPGPRRHGKLRSSNGATERAIFRHRLEAEYFADAGIRTQRVVEDEIDVTLKHNLEELFRYHSLPVDLPTPVREHIEKTLAKNVGGVAPAFALLQEIAQRHHLSLECVRTILYQAIWTRRVRVDLFYPLLIDKPLRAERRDPLAVYASWFAR